MGRLVLFVASCLLCPQAALAHASEQGFVLLLPTDIYIAAGAATVIITVLLLALLPPRWAVGLFTPLHVPQLQFRRLSLLTSLLSTGILWWLIWQGFFTTRDPLHNPLPLTIWVFWWLILVLWQGLVGNIWRYLNPWSGLISVLRYAGLSAPLRLPQRLGHTPALIGLVAFAAFLMADPAPSDPARLARVVGMYWLCMALGGVLFGPRWFVQGEVITLLMRNYGHMAIWGRKGAGAIGIPGWQVVHRMRRPRLSLALFILMLLGCGSFDGLNETFWWFGRLGINPLEFPGRSYVVWQNVTGLILANIALVAIFAACLWLGAKLAQDETPLTGLICRYAPSILPIALGYHLAHYYVSLLIDGQYLLNALYRQLGWDTFHVTVGFLN
ncbi:MAG: hypothetical protein OIF34_03965, partial [Porticoccaceae bacterium]|nr:hypothetical protein [Porticoccaceae bacterium]